ncbi:MAG: hypothetical protein CMJ80_14950, partial [Planctomycetaceae bacterium]|nr:hypothetical protein [Planctomycetaceae bacterium]
MIQRAITWKITADASAALVLLSRRIINFCKHQSFGNRPNIRKGLSSVGGFELTAHLLVEIYRHSLTAEFPLVGESSCLVSQSTFSDIRSRTNLK